MGEDPREEKGEDLGGKGGKGLNQVKRSWGGQGRRSQEGGKGLRGERKKGSQQGKGAKDLREEKGEHLGGEKALGGKGRERISTRKGGKRS